MNKNIDVAVLSEPLELGESSALVEYGADGLPVAWRLFALGSNELGRGGEHWTLDITLEMMSSIMEHYRAKGTKIPLDSRHFLFYLAENIGATEEQVSAMLGDRATFGYGELTARADGLWITQVELVPLAKKIMGEKVLRWFSPVIRGFSNGRWRVTSVAFTNEPALNHLDALAAQAERDMNYLLTKEANMKIETAQTTGLHKVITDALSLDAGASEAVITGVLTSLVEKANRADELKSRVDALELEGEKRQCAELIQKGLSEGKLTDYLVTHWASKQDAVALEAFLSVAPMIVPMGKSAVDLVHSDTLALSAADQHVCRVMGLDPVEYQKTKNKLEKGA